MVERLKNISKEKEKKLYFILVPDDRQQQYFCVYSSRLCSIHRSELFNQNMVITYIILPSF